MLTGTVTFRENRWTFQKAAIAVRHIHTVLTLRQLPTQYTNIFIHIILQSSTCFQHYYAHLQEVTMVKRELCSLLTSVTYGRSQRVTVPDAVHIQLNLLKMSIIMFKTCRCL